MEKRGVSIDKINGILTYDAEGNPINLENKDVKMYMDEVGLDRGAVGTKMLFQALVSFIRIKNAGKQLGEVINVNWDPSREKDRMSQMFLKIFNKVDYDEYYQRNPGHARIMATAYLNTLTAWKRKQVDPVAISINGNPDAARLISQNPVRPDTDAPLVPPLMTTLKTKEYPEGMPLWALKKSKGSEINKTLPDEYKIKVDIRDGERPATDKEIYDLIVNTLDAVRFERMYWRNNADAKMSLPNYIVKVIDDLIGSDDISGKTTKERKKINEELQKLEARARTAFDIHATVYSDNAPQEWRRNQPNRFAVTDGLLKNKRVALSFVDFQSLVESMGFEVSENLPKEEFLGWLGLQKLNSVDKAKHILIGNMEQIQKYVSTYPAMAKAQISAIEKMYVAMNNSIDYVAKNLMGEMPDVMQALSADSMPEALMKTIVNAAFTLSGARKQGDVLKFVDEATEVFVAEVLPVMSFNGRDMTENAMDLLIFMETMKDRAVDAVVYYSNGKKIDSPTHLQSKDKLDFKGMGEFGKAEAQRLLEMAGYGVYYPFGSDVNDKNYFNIKADTQSHLNKNQTVGGDNTSKNDKRIKHSDFNLNKNPIVRYGIDTVRKFDVNDTGDLEYVSQKVRGKYGHQGSERLWLLWTVSRAKDMMHLTTEQEAELYQRLGTSKKELEEAKKDFEERAKKNLLESLKESQKYM